jgi:hypothetical protein
LKSEILFAFYQNKIVNFERYSQASRTCNQLVSCFRAKGIVDKKCFDIKKSKTLILNSSFEDYAYQDKAFPIGAGQKHFTVNLTLLLFNLNY